MQVYQIKTLHYLKILAIYLARKLMTIIYIKIMKDLHMMHINLEKVCNEVLQKALRMRMETY